MKRYENIIAPYQFKEYWSKYPHGYSIYEAILDWLNQVNEMIETLNLTLKEFSEIKKWVTEQLEEFAKEQMIEWLNDGTLEELINSVLFNKKLDKTVFEEHEKIAITLNDTQRNYYDITRNSISIVKNQMESVESQHIALQKLFDNVPEHSTIFIPAGSYFVNETVNITKPISIVGAGMEYEAQTHSKDVSLSMLVCDFDSDSKALIRISAGVRHVKLTNFAIVNNNWTNNRIGRGIGIHVGDVTNEKASIFIDFEDIYTSNFDIGFKIDKAWKVTFNRCIASTNKSYGFNVNGSSSTTTNFIDCWAVGGEGTGYYVTNTSYSYLLGCACDYMNRNAYVFDNCKQLTMISCGTELSGVTAFRFIETDVTMISCYAYQTGRKLTEALRGSATFIYYDECYINSINCREYSRFEQPFDMPNSVTGAGNNAMQFQHLNVIKPIAPSQRVSIDGIYAVTSIPTSPGGISVKTVYNTTYDGSNAKGWTWYPVHGKWVPF